MFENTWELIYQKTWIPADKVYQVLTMEQIGRYTDKAIFQSYEMFKEGKAINDKVVRGTKKGWLSEQDQKDLDFILAQKINANWH